MTPTYATPGDMLGNVSNLNSGKFTYIEEETGNIFASVVGVVHKTAMPDLNGNRTISVKGAFKEKILPEINDIVLCEVKKLDTNRAFTKILCVGGEAVKDAECEGILRIQDIFPKVRDIPLSKSFRAGDIVRAKVISLGNQRNYYLSTAMPDLGVILARKDGEEMKLLDQTSVKAKNGQIESRKVANL